MQESKTTSDCPNQVPKDKYPQERSSTLSVRTPEPSIDTKIGVRVKWTGEVSRTGQNSHIFIIFLNAVELFLFLVAVSVSFKFFTKKVKYLNSKISPFQNFTAGPDLIPYSIKVLSTQF